MKKFLEALSKDEKLKEKFSKQTTTDGLYSVAKPYIGNMAKSDFITEIQGVACLGEQIELGELSEDVLESVSGGMDFDTFKKKAGTVSYVAGKIGTLVCIVADYITKWIKEGEQKPGGEQQTAETTT